MRALLELHGIVVRAGGRVILDVPTLEIGPGETLALLGANGAGKSTLLRVAGALRRHDEGTVLLDGAAATARDLRLATAAVLQRPLLRRGTTQANAETGLRFRGVPGAEAKRLAEPWLERFGIAHLRNAPARLLSGGEGQRVSLARALATRPRLLLLDEPFSALDGPTRGELLADLRSILRESGTAALLATHDVREAAAVADRVAILHEGRIRQVGATADVLRHPADEESARVLWGWSLGLPELLANGHPARSAAR